MKRLLTALVLVLLSTSLVAAERRVKAPARMRAPIQKAAANLQQDTGMGGGQYAYCVARSSQGQMCRDAVYYISAPGTLCAGGCKVCAAVQYSASCGCDPETKQLTGKCTYW